MVNNLTIVKSEIFGNVQCDFYKYGDDIFMTRDQIGRALDYSNPIIAISKLHMRHNDRLDKFSEITSLVSTDGKSYDTCIYTAKGVYEICRWSKQDKANDFVDWVWDVIESIRITGSYTLNDIVPMLDTITKRIEESEEQNRETRKLLIDSGILRTNVNPRYTFDRLNVRYKIATCDDGVRGFYDSIGNYFGINVPYSNTINVTVKDWIIAKMDLDELQEFVVGLETGMITKSLRGHYVNLNGFGGNNIEWQKILDSFGHQCAYCGCDDKALIPEHIVNQSYLSQSNPEAVDLIGNIVPACGSCNKSKNTHDVDEWYPTHPQFKQWKLDKIHKHQAKYRLEI